MSRVIVIDNTPIAYDFEQTFKVFDGDVIGLLKLIGNGGVVNDNYSTDIPSKAVDPFQGQTGV